MIKPQTLKGFRDFLPKEAKKRQYAIDAIKVVFESYGFEPLETPAIEYEEVLLGKYGEEGDKLMYRFEDKGGRKVALRYDQTVPLARVVAQYGTQLPTPFKRYQIQPVWRGENPQKGRFREFLQCDADIVGVNSSLADAEILSLAYNIYKNLGLEVLIKINDRALLKEISARALTVLDKLNKIGDEGVRNELRDKGFSKEEIDNLFKQAKAFETSEYLQKVMDQYEQMGNPINSIKFEGTLVRGLEYYTGMIFEVVLRLNPESLSLCGGGRYDNLIGMFTNNQIPAVGFAIGFDRTIEVMEQQNLFQKIQATTSVLVTTYPGYLEYSIKIVEVLRQNNINSEIYLELDKEDNPPMYDKQLKYANRKNVSFVLFKGPKESRDEVTVKDMRTGEQKIVKLDYLPDAINH